MKYVVVQNDMGQLVPIVFPKTINHNTIPKIGRCHTVVSAGFCYHDGKEWRAFGESMTLRIKSRPEDGKLITEAFKPEEW